MLGIEIFSVCPLMNMIADWRPLARVFVCVTPSVGLKAQRELLGCLRPLTAANPRVKVWVFIVLRLWCTRTLPRLSLRGHTLDYADLQALMKRKRWVRHVSRRTESSLCTSSLWNESVTSDLVFSSSSSVLCLRLQSFFSLFHTSTRENSPHCNGNVLHWEVVIVLYVILELSGSGWVLVGVADLEKRHIETKVSKSRKVKLVEHLL